MTRTDIMNFKKKGGKSQQCNINFGESLNIVIGKLIKKKRAGDEGDREGG